MRPEQADARTKSRNPARRELLIRSASYASVSVALSLVILKTWAWLTTGSVALLSSLADSVLDVVASVLTFWAVRYSLSPADREHRFGHGKSEGLAALFQSLVIAGSALFVCFEAVPRLINPQPIERPGTGLIVLIAATAASVLLVSYQRMVAARTGSIAIGADALHYTADILVNLGAGLALVLSAWTGWRLADPVAGLLIAFYILFGAYRVGAQSLNILLDHEIPELDRVRVRGIALGHPDVKGLHDLRTRHGGSNYIIQFHLDLPREMSLWRSHEILDEVEDQIRQAYPGCEIIIHADPIGIQEPQDEFDRSPVTREKHTRFG